MIIAVEVTLLGGMNGEHMVNNKHSQNRNLNGDSQAAQKLLFQCI